MNIGSLALGIVASILFALHDPTPYALVWGNVVAIIANVAGGHRFLHGPSNRLAWDRGAATGIISFGGWVMLSSAVGFMTGEGNKLVLGSVLDIRLLGLVGLASTLSVVLSQAVASLSSQVLFPAYSELMRSDPTRLSRAVERARRVQIVPVWIGALAFAAFGPQIVHLLYDPRYADAGIILQILAVGSMVSVLNNSFAGVLWAMGRVGLSTAILAVQVGLQLLGIVIGHALYGQVGAIVGLAASGWALYPLHAALYARLGIWHPRTDLPVLSASAVAAVAAAFPDQLVAGFDMVSVMTADTASNSPPLVSIVMPIEECRAVCPASLGFGTAGVDTSSGGDRRRRWLDRSLARDRTGFCRRADSHPGRAPPGNSGQRQHRIAGGAR